MNRNVLLDLHGHAQHPEFIDRNAHAFGLLACRHLFVVDEAERDLEIGIGAQFLEGGVELVVVEDIPLGDALPLQLALDLLLGIPGTFSFRILERDVDIAETPLVDHDRLLVLHGERGEVVAVGDRKALDCQQGVGERLALANTAVQQTEERLASLDLRRLEPVYIVMPCSHQADVPEAPSRCRCLRRAQTCGGGLCKRLRGGGEPGLGGGQRTGSRHRRLLRLAIVVLAVGQRALRLPVGRCLDRGIVLRLVEARAGRHQRLPRLKGGGLLGGVRCRRRFF